MAVTGTNSENQDMRVKVKELEVDGAAVTATPAAENVTVDPPASDTSWVDVQSALDDIAARLAVLET